MTVSQIHDTKMASMEWLKEKLAQDDLSLPDYDRHLAPDTTKKLPKCSIWKFLIP